MVADILMTFIGITGVLIVLAMIYPRTSIYVMPYALFSLPITFSLSPEISVAGGSSRDVTVRIEDLILTILLLRVIGEIILNKEWPFKKGTLAIGMPLFLYSNAMIFATAMGIMFHNVSPFSGTFYVLKLLEYYIFFMIIHFFIRNENDIRVLVIGSVITVIIISINGLTQIPSGGRTFMPFEGSDPEPNTFGGYYVLVLPIIAALYYFETVKWKQMVYIGTLGISALPFIYTQSRTSWAAGGLAIFVFVAITRGIRFKAGLAFAIGALILSYPTWPDNLKERANIFKAEAEFSRTQSIGSITFEPSTSERIQRYRRAPAELAKRPILGYGVTGRGFIDGQYLRVLLETGILGMIAYIYLWFSILRFLYLTYRHSHHRLQRALAMGLFCSTSGLLLHCVGATTFFLVRISEPYWLFMAMVTSYNKFTPKEFLGYLREERGFTYQYVIGGGRQAHLAPTLAKDYKVSQPKAALAPAEMREVAEPTVKHTYPYRALMKEEKEEEIVTHVDLPSLGRSKFQKRSEQKSKKRWHHHQELPEVIDLTKGEFRFAIKPYRPLEERYIDAPPDIFSPLFENEAPVDDMFFEDIDNYSEVEERAYREAIERELNEKPKDTYAYAVQAGNGYNKRKKRRRRRSGITREPSSSFQSPIYGDT